MFTVEMSSGEPSKGGEKRRQHYVPQFLLRRFSADGRSICLVVLSSGQRIQQAGIKEQCQESYFYGRDLEVENEFMAEESWVASTLGDLTADRLCNLSVEGRRGLARFALRQRMRTLGSAEALNAQVDAFAKPMLRTGLKVNHDIDVSTADLDGVRVRLKRAQDVRLHGLSTMGLVIDDLAVKFVTTDRTPGFVVADHPVVFYNQYAETHSDLRHCLGITGLAARGLQMFLPLSPSMMLAVYDPAVYGYGGSSLICRAGPADVSWLNKMQAANALRCLYVDERRTSDASIDELLATRLVHGAVAERTRRLESDINEQADGTWRQIVAVIDGDLRLGARLSFVRHLDQRPYPGWSRPHAPVRSEQLLAAVEAARDTRRGSPDDRESSSSETEVIVRR